MDEERLRRWREPHRWRRPGRVVLAGGASLDPADPLPAALVAAGVTVKTSALRDDSGRVDPAVAEAEVVVSGGARLDAGFFAALRTTRLLLRPYVGYDDIDVAAATDHGVLVANVPDAIAEDVAVHAVALILAAVRQLSRLDRFVRTGGWATDRAWPRHLPLHRPSALTLGLIGFGPIGRETARRARAFGFRILASDPNVPPGVVVAHGAEPVSLDELLRRSDVISIHTRLEAGTRHLIDARRLAVMKPEAWIVNTSRGAVIDQEALITALQARRLGGAALDVVEEEPLDPASPLARMDNVILTPHIAGFTREGSRRLRERAAEIALSVASGGLPERHVIVNQDLYDRLVAMPELVGVPRAPGPATGGFSARTERERGT